MTEYVYKPYLGVGTVWGKFASGYLSLGNLSSLAVSPQEDVKEVMDYTKLGGGTYAEVRRLTSLDVKMVLHDLNTRNLAMATYGLETNVALGTVTDEAHIAKKGVLLRLAHISPTSVVVKDTATPTPTTYTLNTDYVVKNAGIYIPVTSTITDDTPLVISYSHAAYDTVQALTSASVIIPLMFDGLNEAESGKAVILDIWRCSLGPASELAMIGDDFSSFEINGRALIDPTRTGAGMSKYMQVRYA